MNSTGVNQTEGCVPYICPDRSVSPLYVLLYISAAAAVLLTVFGNLLVIISICHFKQLHTPTNMLILSLAVSDFLVGVLVMPVVEIWIIESCWVFRRLYCICFLLASYYLTSTSIYSVSLIAVDRYFALSNPFLYTQAVSVNAMCIVILCTWFILLSYISTLLYFNIPFKIIISCPANCFFLLDEVWSLVDLLVTFVFPCALIILLYSLVFIIAKKHATAIRELKTQRTKSTADSSSERKAAKVVTVLVSVFVACLLPYFILTLLDKVVQIESELVQNALILLYLNSAINPVIYALFYPWFRKCVKLVFTLQMFSTDSALIHVL